MEGDGEKLLLSVAVRVKFIQTEFSQLLRRDCDEGRHGGQLELLCGAAETEVKRKRGVGKRDLSGDEGMRDFRESGTGKHI